MPATEGLGVLSLVRAGARQRHPAYCHNLITALVLCTGARQDLFQYAIA